jgi:DNA (cytosine-5)-methyltransferase 1
LGKNVNELSLFSGAGGGLLGTKLLGWRTVGYVEWNEHCQKVIRQRIEDGILDPAPVFCDIRAFIREGFAASYQGLVDVITAGFPCQPFSTSGHQRGGADERNMWPSTIECIRLIRPDSVLLENVPGLLANQYIHRIFGDLAESGYDANWCVLGGSSTDSCCDGKRLWIVASKADSSMLESLDFSKTVITCAEEPCRRQYSGAIGEMLQQDDYTGVKRNSHAVAEGMERLKAIGNGQNPLLVKRAWKLLTRESCI